MICLRATAAIRSRWVEALRKLAPEPERAAEKSAALFVLLGVGRGDLLRSWTRFTSVSDDAVPTPGLRPVPQCARILVKCARHCPKGANFAWRL